MANANIHAGNGAVKGVAIREFPLNPGNGFADYLLYVNGKACGVIEAKRAGATLCGAEVQSARYAQGLPANLPVWRQVLEYFDAYLIGLTAAPNKQTPGFFNQSLVMEYGHARAVVDGVNLNYYVYRSQIESVSRLASKVVTLRPWPMLISNWTVPLHAGLQLQLTQHGSSRGAGPQRQRTHRMEGCAGADAEVTARGGGWRGKLCINTASLVATHKLPSW